MVYQPKRSVKLNDVKILHIAKQRRYEVPGLSIANKSGRDIWRNRRESTLRKQLEFDKRTLNTYVLKMYLYIFYRSIYTSGLFL